MISPSVMPSASLFFTKVQSVSPPQPAAISGAGSSSLKPILNTFLVMPASDAHLENLALRATKITPMPLTSDAVYPPDTCDIYMMTRNRHPEEPAEGRRLEGRRPRMTGRDCVNVRVPCPHSDRRRARGR